MKDSSRSFKLERAHSLGYGRSNVSLLVASSESLSAKLAGYKKLSKSMRLTNSYDNENYNDSKLDNQRIGDKKKKSLSFRFISKVFSFGKKNNTMSDFDDEMRERLDVNETEEKKKKKRFSVLGGGSQKR